MSEANKSRFARKTILCQKNKNKTVWCCTKSHLVLIKKVDLPKKLFHVDKNKFVLHKKNISWSKKLLFYSQNGTIKIHIVSLSSLKFGNWILFWRIVVIAINCTAIKQFVPSSLLVRLIGPWQILCYLVIN